jgi:hypothetical protein
MHGYQHSFHGRATISLSEQSLDTGHMNAHTSEEHEGKEEHYLPACEQPLEAAASWGKPVGRCEDYEALTDVGVAADFVGVCVMGVVLGDPPAEAHPDQRIPDHQPEQPVRPAGPKDLLVPSVMADEAQLGEHQA